MKRTPSVIFAVVICTVAAAGLPAGATTTATGAVASSGAVASGPAPLGGGDAAGGPSDGEQTATSPVERKRTLFEVSFDRGRLAVGESTTVRVTVRAEEDVGNLSMEVVSAPRIDVVDVGRLPDSLTTGETARTTVTIRPTAAVDRTLEVQLRGVAKGHRIVRSFAHRVPVASETTGRVADDAGNGTDTATHPVDLNVSVRPRGDGGSNGSRLGPEAVAPTATSYVSGTAEYVADGSKHPMRQVTVEVYDHDSTGDDLLATTTTDDNGDFFTSFDANADLTTNSDVYIVVYAKNPAAVATDGSGNTYTLDTSSNVVWDVSGGQVIDYGTMDPTSGDSQAWAAIDYALDEYRYIRDNAGGWTRDRVRIEWPEGTWPSHVYSYNTFTGSIDRSSERIEVPSQSTANWGRGAILHEYGHAVMTAAYDWDQDNLPSKGSYSCHVVFSETDPGFATIEGWAEFMEAAVDGDPSAVSDIGGDVESNNWFNMSDDGGGCPGSDVGDMDGNRVEGSAASIWFDIIDSGNANDESLDESFDAVFSTVADNNVQDMDHFWRVWSHGNRDELKAIYFEYGIDKNGDPTVAAPTPPDQSRSYVYPSGWIDPPSCCGIPVSTGSASDPDGDGVSKVRFFYSTDGGTTWTHIGTDTDGSDGWQANWDDSIAITRSNVAVKAQAHDGIEWGPASVDSSWDLDNTRPDFPPDLDDGLSGYVNTRDVTFTWNRPSDEGSGVSGYYVELDDATPDGELTDPGTTSRSYTGLSDGAHTFYATTYDGVRLENGPVEHTVEIDTRAPDSDVADAHAARQWSSDGTVSLDADDRIGGAADIPPAGVDRLCWQVDGGTTSCDRDGSHTVSVPDGKHDLEFWARDTSGDGNVEAHESVEVWIDTAAPSAPSSVSGPDGWTTDDTPTVSWSAASDATSGVDHYQVRVDGGSWTDVGGDTTATLGSLSSGTHTVSVRAVDVAGNAGAAASTTVTVDTAAPSLAIDRPADGAVRNDTSLTVAGTATDGLSGLDRVSVSTDGGATWTPAIGTTDWSFDWTAPGDGTVNLSARATDVAGNVRTRSVTVTIDTSPPGQPAPAGPGGWTNDTTPAVTWTGVTDATSGVDRYRVRVDGGPWTDVGATSFAPPSGLADGEHAVDVRAVDAAGNRGPAGTTTVSVDGTPPSAPAAVDGPTGWVNDSTPTVSWDAATDATSGVDRYQVRVDGGAWTDVGDSLTTTLRSLASGTHTVSVRAVDAAGNRGPVERTSVRVDVTTPSVAIDAPADGAVVDSRRVRVNGSTADDHAGVAAVAYRVDGDAWTTIQAGGGNWSFETAPLAEGNHVVTIRTVDAAGNVAKTSVTVTVDASPPDRTPIEPPAPTNASQVGLSWSPATDAESVVTGYEVSVDGGSWSGVGNTTATDLALAEGTHSVAVRAVDAAGNRGPESVVNVTVDRTGPDAPGGVTGPDGWTADDTPSVSWSATTDATSGVDRYQVRVDGGAWTDVGDSLTTTLRSLASGTHTVSVRAVDAAGNRGPGNATAVRVDASEPALTVEAPTDGAAVNRTAVTVAATATDDHAGVANLSVRVDDGPWTTLAATGTGRWEGLVDALADGDHVLTVRASDAAGNTNLTGVALVVDTVSPSLAVGRPTTDAPSLVRPGGRTNVSVGYADATVGTVTIRIENDTRVVGETVVSELADGVNHTAAVPVDEATRSGSYDVTVVGRDRAGNRQTTTVQGAVRVDEQPPVVTGVGLNRTLVGPGDAIGVTVTATDNFGIGGVRVGDVSLANRSGAWTGRVTANASNGTHTLAVTVVDSAGNAVTNDSVTYRVDASPPALTVDVPRFVNGTGVDVAGTATDPAGVDRVTVTAGAESRTLHPGGDGFATDVPLDEGATDVVVTAVDRFGNRNRSVHTVVRDTRRPTATMAAPGTVTNTTAPTIRIRRSDGGSGVTDSVASLTVDGRSVAGNATVHPDGTVTVSATGLAEGDHVVAIAFADRAGNRRTENWTVTVDLTAPSVHGVVVNRTEAVAPGAPLAVGVNATDAETGVATVTAGSGATRLSNASGRWSGTVSASPAIGDRTLVVAVRDAAGNVERATVPYEVGTTAALRRVDPTTLTARPNGTVVRRVAVRTVPNATDVDNETVHAGTATSDPIDAGPPAGTTLYYPQVETSVGTNTTASGNLTLFVPDARVEARFVVHGSLSFWVHESGSWRSLNGSRVATVDDGRVYRVRVPHFSTFAITGRQESRPPAVTSFSPTTEATAGDPVHVTARYGDGYAGVDPGDVRLVVDGEDVTADATVGETALTYRTVPTVGEHNVTLRVVDRAGNAVTESWSFEAVADRSGGGATGGGPIGGSPVGGGSGDTEGPSTATPATPTPTPRTPTPTTATPTSRTPTPTSTTTPTPRTPTPASTTTATASPSGTAVTATPVAPAPATGTATGSPSLLGMDAPLVGLVALAVLVGGAVLALRRR